MEEPFVFENFEAEYERHSPPRQAKSSFISLKNAWNRGNMEEVRRHANALEPKMRDAKRKMPKTLVQQLAFLKKCKAKPKPKKAPQNSNTTNKSASEKELAVSGSGFESPTAAVRLPPLTAAADENSTAPGATAQNGGVKAKKPEKTMQISPRRPRGTMKELEEKVQQLERWIQNLHEGLQTDTVETVETSGPKSAKGKPQDPVYEQMGAIVESVKQKKVQMMEDFKKLKRDLKTKEDYMNFLEREIKKLEEDVKSEKLEEDEPAQKTGRRQKAGTQTDRDKDKDDGLSPNIVATLRKTILSQKATLTSSVQGMTTELKTKTDRLKDLENAINQLSEDIKTEQYKKEEPKTNNVAKKGRLQQSQGIPRKKSADTETGGVRQVMVEIKKHLRQKDTQLNAEMQKLKHETQYAKERLEAEAGTRDIKTKQFGKQLQDDNRSLQRTVSEKEGQMESLHKAIEEMYTSVVSDLGKDNLSSARGKQTTVKTQPEADALKLRDVNQGVSELKKKLKDVSLSLKSKEEELVKLQNKTADIFGKLKQVTQDSKGTPRTSSGEKDFRRMLSEIQIQLDKPSVVKEKTFEIDNPPDKELEMINLKAALEELRETERKREQTIRSLQEEKTSLEKQLKAVQEKLDKTTNDNSVGTPRTQGRITELETKLAQVQEEKDTLIKRLSESIGTKVTTNNPNVADLSDPNRPTKLGEQFSQVYDDEWSEAFEKLSSTDTTKDDDEKTSLEKKVIETLLSILTDTYTFCKGVSAAQLSQLQQALYAPSPSGDPKTAKPATNKGDHASVDSAAILDMRKKTSLSSLEHVKENFLRHISADKKYDGLLDKCSPYVDRCVEMCWKMCLQAPPVVIDSSVRPGAVFDTDVFRHYTKSGKTVDFLVWPPMFLHEGGPLISKGVAQGR